MKSSEEKKGIKNKKKAEENFKFPHYPRKQ